MTNSEYATIAHALEVCYSVQAENSKEEAVETYTTLIQDKQYADRLRAELSRAFSDPLFSWRHALFNRQYEIDEVESEEEAREYVRRLLWLGYLD